jgi:hypothetical protein
MQMVFTVFGPLFIFVFVLLPSFQKNLNSPRVFDDCFFALLLVHLYVHCTLYTNKLDALYVT